MKERTRPGWWLGLVILMCSSLGYAQSTEPAGGQPKADAQSTQSADSQPQKPKPFLDIYGFVQMDAGYDFKQVDPDWFDVIRPTKLPSKRDEFGADGNTYFSVRQT